MSKIIMRGRKGTEQYKKYIRQKYLNYRIRSMYDLEVFKDLVINNGMFDEELYKMKLNSISDKYSAKLHKCYILYMSGLVEKNTISENEKINSNTRKRKTYSEVKSQDVTYEKNSKALVVNKKFKDFVFHNGYLSCGNYSLKSVRIPEIPKGLIVGINEDFTVQFEKDNKFHFKPDKDLSRILDCVRTYCISKLYEIEQIVYACALELFRKKITDDGITAYITFDSIIVDGDEGHCQLEKRNICNSWNFPISYECNSRYHSYCKAFESKSSKYAIPLLDIKITIKSKAEFEAEFKREYEKILNQHIGEVRFPYNKWWFSSKTRNLRCMGLRLGKDNIVTSDLFSCQFPCYFYKDDKHRLYLNENEIEHVKQFCEWHEEKEFSYSLKNRLSMVCEGKGPYMIDTGIDYGFLIPDMIREAPIVYNFLENNSHYSDTTISKSSEFFLVVTDKFLVQYPLDNDKAVYVYQIKDGYKNLATFFVWSYFCSYKCNKRQDFWSMDMMAASFGIIGVSKSDFFDWRDYRWL